jgi:ATP phosphoribosyltransferase regulatory subunit HisZ
MGKSGQAIGFAVYMDQLGRYGTEEDGCDVDVLLLYKESSNPAAVASAAQSLRAKGNTVRVERTIPAGLRYRDCREVE